MNVEILKNQLDLAAHTLVHHPSCWPLIQTLQQLKKQADPNNRLQALRWASSSKRPNREQRRLAQ